MGRGKNDSLFKRKKRKNKIKKEKRRKTNPS